MLKSIKIKVFVIEPVSEGVKIFLKENGGVFSCEISYLHDSRGNNKSKGMQRIGMDCSPHFYCLSSASTDVILLAVKLSIAVCQHSDVLLISQFTKVT